MKKVICCILILGVSSLVFSQETEVIKKTKVYLKPGVEKTIIGELLPGVTVTKLKKDRTGQYIKATIEFYIPMESLLEGRVSKKIGERQIADNAVYKLYSVKRDGKSVHISLQIKNTGAKNLDFAPMMLLKLYGKGKNFGELNPFKGTNQGLASIPPNGTITAELHYDFKVTPKKVELVCTAIPGGDRVYYLLGF